ncbi:MAG: hypothetical protein EXQ89_01350 [Rhodospirillaceae bacterium]|nr:hypothetical protein [Rhodospirillaceae bacterium]
MTKRGASWFFLVCTLGSTVVAAAVVTVSGVAEWGLSIHGYVAMGLGLFFSLAVGIGLMTLVFYSARSGHDDRT